MYGERITRALRRSGDVAARARASWTRKHGALCRADTAPRARMDLERTEARNVRDEPLTSRELNDVNFPIAPGGGGLGDVSRATCARRRRPKRRSRRRREKREIVIAYRLFSDVERDA